MDKIFEHISQELEMLGAESKEGSNEELMIAYCGLKIVIQRMMADCNSFRFDVLIDADFKHYTRRQLLEMANQLSHESDAWKLYVDKKGKVCAYYTCTYREFFNFESSCCSQFLYLLHLLMKSILIPMDSYDGGLILLPMDVKKYNNYFMHLSDLFEDLEGSFADLENIFINEQTSELRENLDYDYRLLGKKIASHTRNILNI